MNDYCHSCFANGAFTDPNISMQVMIDRCVGIMAKTGDGSRPCEFSCRAILGHCGFKPVRKSAFGDVQRSADQARHRCLVRVAALGRRGA